MYAKVLLVLALAGVANCVKYIDCGKGLANKYGGNQIIKQNLGAIKSVSISDCTTDVCTLTRGKNVTFNVDFTADAAATSATAVVHGIIARVPVPFPIENPDGCNGCGLTCPLKSGSEYKYHNTIFVKSAYPAISLTVKWELKNKSGQDLFCLLVPVEIH